MGKYDGVLISQSDCFKVISEKLKTKDFKILRHQQIAFDEINGYLGDHCTLEITIVRNGIEETFSFFVKNFPRVPSQREFLEEINGFFKEKNFYGRYHPELKKYGIDILDNAIPTCYLVNDETFIFEDLKAFGYETLPSRIPLSIDCIKTALVTLAKLHASGLILEETKSFRLPDEYSEELTESFYTGKGLPEKGLKAAKFGLSALIDLTHRDDMKISKETFKEEVIKGLDLQIVFTTPSTKFRNTVCHADAWTKNFLFKFENGKPKHCIIVDYQVYRYGPPAQDVLAFIYLVAGREVWDKHLDELLSFYYKELRANIDRFGFKDVITPEEFFESCCYFKQFALTQSLTHFQVVLLSDEIAKELFGDSRRSESVIFGKDRYEFVKMVCERDPVFRKRVFDHIAGLRSYFEKKLIK